MQVDKKMTLSMLAKKNIKRKPVRSFILILFLMLFTTSMFTGTVVSIGLSRGVSSLKDRLGADVMIVPEGYDAHIDSVLLSGDPCSFYLPGDVMERLDGIEGIDKMTPQTYLATLSASCCSYPVQIIGIDYDSDYIIKPWLTEDMKKGLEDGQVIVGYRVNGTTGNTVRFFNQEYNVAGRLQQTGMAFDTTVFMTRKTASHLAIEAERIMDHPLSKDDSLISTVMVKLKPGYDSTVVAKKINNELSKDGIFALYSKKFVNDVSSNLGIISSYITSTIVVFWVLSIVVISLLFTLSFQERKKELAVLRALGTTKKQLVHLIVKEAWFIGMYGSSLGIVVSTILIAGIVPSVTKKLTIPFLLPAIGSIIGIGVLCFAIGTLTGILSSLFAASKITKGEIYSNLRENA